PVAGNRFVAIALGLFVAALMGSSTAYAQQQPAAAPTNQFVFPGDGGVILNFVKADKTADFEMVLGKVKEGLLKSDKPQRKEQGAGWRVMKATEPGPGGAVIYVFMFNPVAKGADYSVGSILVEAFGQQEGTTLYKTYSDSYGSPAIGALLHLTNVLDFSK